jgi:hypothetical protein
MRGVLLHHHREDDIENAEHRKRLQKGPDIPKDAAVIAHLEVRPSQRSKETPLVGKIGGHKKKLKVEAKNTRITRGNI